MQRLISHTIVAHHIAMYQVAPAKQHMPMGIHNELIGMTICHNEIWANSYKHSYQPVNECKSGSEMMQSNSDQYNGVMCTMNATGSQANITRVGLGQ